MDSFPPKMVQTLQDSFEEFAAAIFLKLLNCRSDRRKDRDAIFYLQGGLLLASQFDRPYGY
jgi:hypothetical protein